MKKFLKIVITIFAIWLAIFSTDYYRCTKMKKPIFAYASVTADDGGSGIYHGLGYRININMCIDAEYGAVVEKIDMSLLGVDIFHAIAEIDKTSSENKLPPDVEIIENLPGMIVSMVSISRIDGDLRYGLKDEDAQIILDYVTNIDTENLWGDPYDDLPDIRISLMGDRVLYYNSRSGVLTDENLDKAVPMTKSDVADFNKIVRDYIQANEQITIRCPHNT